MRRLSSREKWQEKRGRKRPPRSLASSATLLSRLGFGLARRGLLRLRPGPQAAVSGRAPEGPTAREGTVSDRRGACCKAPFCEFSGCLRSPFEARSRQRPGSQHASFLACAGGGTRRGKHLGCSVQPAGSGGNPAGGHPKPRWEISAFLPRGRRLRSRLLWACCPACPKEASPARSSARAGGK